MSKFIFLDGNAYANTYEKAKVQVEDHILESGKLFHLIFKPLVRVAW